MSISGNAEKFVSGSWNIARALGMTIWSTAEASDFRASMSLEAQASNIWSITEALGPKTGKVVKELFLYFLLSLVLRLRMQKHLE